MLCWKGSEEFSSNPGLLLFEDVFPSWPVLFSSFSVVQFLVYVFDYFIYLNTHCICVNYSQIWIIVIYFLSPMIKIEKILNTFWFLLSHFWWTLANKSFFWTYIYQEWYAVLNHSLSIRYKNEISSWFQQ